ncbi:MAG: hypothetical protein WC488_03755 [Candidatus Micrarchaeia archaeon]
MDVSELTKKENLYKIGAVVLVLVFVLEMFSMNFFSTNSGGSNNETPGQVEGEVMARALVAGYQPYIVTSLKDDSQLSSIRGISGVEDVMKNAQGYVVSVGNEEDVVPVYAKLLEMNVSGRANAVLSLPEEFNVSDGTNSQTVGGAEISSKLEPIFDIGDNITIQVFVRAREGVVVAYGTVNVVPSLKELRKNATVVALVGSETLINVPWEQRHSINPELEAIRAKYGTGNVTYTARDYVTGALAGAKPAYVTLVSGDTIFVGNFTNQGQVLLDVQNATFPDSLLVVKGSADELENFTRDYIYRYNVRLEGASQPIFVALESSGEYAAGDVVEVLVSAYAIKDRITSVETIREA